MSDKVKKAFGKRLSDLVGDVDQKILIKRWGVVQSMVSAYTNGTKMPSIAKACEIAQKEGVCVEWLLTGSGSKTPSEAKRSLSREQNYFLSTGI